MVLYMGQMLERFQKTTKSVSHTTCLLMDHIYIIYAVLTTVLLLYIQLFISCFCWLCFTSIILGFIIPVCDIRECLVCFLLASGLGDTEGSFYVIFATTLTHSPVHFLSQTSPPSSSTTSRPLNSPPRPWQARQLILRRWSAVVLTHARWLPISFWLCVYIYKA